MIIKILLFILRPSICITSLVLTANHITHLPTATLSIDQPNRSPGLLKFQRLRLILDSEDGFCMHRLTKRQSYTKVLLRTPITQMRQPWKAVSGFSLVRPYQHSITDTKPLSTYLCYVANNLL